MTIRSTLMILACFASYILHAQDKNLLRIDVLLPGLTYENRLSDFWMWESRIGITALSDDILTSKKENKGTYFVDFPVVLSTQMNYFYNTNKRLKLWKSIDMNSGNYFCLGMAYAKNTNWNITNRPPKENALSDSKYLYAGWGLIRNMNQLQYINLTLGARYTFETHTFSPHIQLKYGFTILWNQKEHFNEQFR